MRLKISKGDITTIECDAIVCSTNKSLLPAGHVDSAIHEVAGKSLTMECALLAPCYVGDCVITKGYNLPSKHVIHTVPPHVNDNESAHWLAQCYKKAIQRAIQKRYSSIAFPLLGSGNNGFPVEKALDIALNKLDSSRRDTRYKDSDLLIYLVLFDEDTWSLALQVINDKKIDVEIDTTRSEVLTVDKHWISLCKVNRPDRNNDIWMQRLADSVDGILIAPDFDDNKEKVFDNRPLIYCENGPNEPDTIGFWEWTERKSDSGRWQSSAIYVEDIVPIEIIMLRDPTCVQEIVDALKDGLHIPIYIRGSVMFAIQTDVGIEGVLCDIYNFYIRPGKPHISIYATLKKSVFSLPTYVINDEDVFEWRDRKVYKYYTIAPSSKNVFTYKFTETIKQLLLQCTSWPIAKSQGISKSEWQRLKQFLNDIPKSSVVDQLSQMYNISELEAQECVDAFLEEVENYINLEDFDSSLIVRILSNHENLKLRCTELAYEQWCNEHKAELERASEEVAEVYAKAEKEKKDAQQHLLDIKKSTTAAEVFHEELLGKITTAQEEIDRLTAEIDQYETLGNETMVAVRQKITDAQKDMAGFIADLSVFLPQAQPQAPVEPPKSVSLWQYECASSSVYTDDEIELSETWNDELDALIQNLVQSQAVHSDYVGMLSAFLYATHVNKIPLLIAGPAGRDFAEIMAVSLYASGAGHLWLGNEPANNIAEAVADYDECIVSVQNMFGKGWQDELPQSFAKLKKQIIWAHPYVEDMVIEPKGLLNYMLPVLSECFIESIPVGEPWPTKRAETFKAYASTKKQPLKIAAFKKLKLSKLLANRLTIVLSDAKAILNQPAKDKDMEILFGLLPLCVITGRIDVLKEAIETESGISSAVKTEANRYIEEE